MSNISEAEKQRRRRISESVIGTHLMEGLPPDAATRSLLKQYEDGDLTQEDLSDALRAHALGVVNEARTVGVA
jgi:Antitoxin VbhA